MTKNERKRNKEKTSQKAIKLPNACPMIIKYTIIIIARYDLIKCACNILYSFNLCISSPQRKTNLNKFQKGIYEKSSTPEGRQTNLDLAV